MKNLLYAICLVMCAMAGGATYGLFFSHKTVATEVAPTSPAPTPEDLSIKVINANWYNASEWAFNNEINAADRFIKRGWTVASITADHRSIVIVLQPPVLAAPKTEASK